MILDASPANERLFLAWGAASAFVAVAAGAFGAHALEASMAADLLEIFETAAQYQLIHAFAIILSGMLCARRRGRSAPLAGWLFLIGTFLFSGSLYTLALSGVRTWGAVTPLGGVAWLGGWAVLTLAGIRRRDDTIEISPED